jgi:CubicO group peptidase (beta-lactamase class C family)
VTIDKTNPSIKAALDLLDARIADTQELKGIPGVALAVVLDQEVIFSKGYGYANLEKKIPMNAQNVFRIGSITKLFTSTMMMQLRDAGKLCLDDPLEKYIPAFKIKSRFPDARPTTFRMIAAHISGLPIESTMNVWGELNFPPIDVFLEKLAEAEMIFPSYTTFKYSNLGISILGHALEVIAKQPYREYIKEHILEPLGMTNTNFELNSDLKSRLAAGYIMDAEGVQIEAPIFDIGGMTPAGQLYSTVGDLAKFIMLQFREEPAGGSQILGGTSLREMRSPVFLFNNENSLGIGIAWFIEKACEKYSRVGHSGGIHGFSSYLTLVPGLKLGIALCSNSQVSDVTGLSGEAITSLGGITARLVEQEEIIDQRKGFFRPEWAPYLGEYVFAGQKLIIKVFENKLVVTSAADEPSARTFLFPEGENTFRAKGAIGGGELLVFVYGDDGKIKEARLGSYVAERMN